MLRKQTVLTGFLAAVAAAAALTGCSMCRDSCDYSAPVISGSVGDTTPPGVRAGSAISAEAPIMTVADGPAPIQQ